MTELEIRERHRAHLDSLLRIKKDMIAGNPGDKVLQEEISRAVAKMMTEDIAIIEQLNDVKAIDK